jgi:hypothetical protein
VELRLSAFSFTRDFCAGLTGNGKQNRASFSHERNSDISQLG